MTDDRIQKIPVSIVEALVAEQFPQWKSLPVKTVELSGWDNHTFRLGQKMLVRLPSASRYEPQVKKEHEWLPKLSKNLSYQISEPLVIGKPSSMYPWHWSVYRWIEGKSLNMLKEEVVQKLATPAAQCLKELHQASCEGGPTPGKHNFYRGGSLSIYDSETQTAMKKLEGIANIEAVQSLWSQALQSKWERSPLWVHGDYSTGNILAKENRLVAVIDFGSMAVGDPACDLVIAWTVFKGDARRNFKKNFSFDGDTWVRARGWALWKALIAMASIREPSDQSFIKLQGILSDLLSD